MATSCSQQAMEHLLGFRPSVSTLVACLGLGEPHLAKIATEVLVHLKETTQGNDVSLSPEPTADSIPTAHPLEQSLISTE